MVSKTYMVEIIVFIAVIGFQNILNNLISISKSFKLLKQNQLVLTTKTRRNFIYSD